jgi:NitT/TauT family transport system ATP-binding protein
VSHAANEPEDFMTMSTVTEATSPRSAPQVAFRCQSLTVDLGAPPHQRRIIAGVDLEISQGEFVCILGESGVGKTTLLRTFGGLTKPASGSMLEAGGRPVDGPPPGTVVVFQNYAASLLPWRTARRNVELGLESSMGRAERRARAEECLDLVGLLKHKDSYPWQFSGGMQQRVQIARALAIKPSLLLMDEPFGALDAMTRENLQDQLLEIRRRTSSTIIFITHDVDEAVYLADRLIVLKGSPSSVGLDLRSPLGPERDQVKTKEHPDYLALRRTIHGAVSDRGAGSDA